jgi:AmmeMemoRadiSam system protein A
MVHMSFTEIEAQHQPLLLDVARESIAYGLEHGRGKDVDVGDYSPALCEHRATFVTLKLNGQLQGCIGTLEAYRPLVTDVVANAYAAAFSDPRFPPVTHAQLPHLAISISILSPPEELTFKNESELQDQLRADIDGLILREGSFRGTFLPSVWKSLPDKRQFLEHLKLKAGLSVDYWSDKIQVYRYTTQSFGQE